MFLVQLYFFSLLGSRIEDIETTGNDGFIMGYFILVHYLQLNYRDIQNGSVKMSSFILTLTNPFLRTKTVIDFHLVRMETERWLLN